MPARWPVVHALLLAATFVHGTAQAAPPAAEVTRASFALIIGVNASPEPGVTALQYADDDAAGYFELFRALGARTYVLSRLDENTRRLHAQVAAEVVPPRRAELRKAVASLKVDIAQARARGVLSTLYVVYAGHGVVQDSGWAVTLEDDRLDGGELLSQIVEPASADRSHLIIDACQAEMLALPRGPGGVRRSLGGFVEREAATRGGRVGYLLSSSVSGETHEWAGFEAGVFSHEVRSGLYGAADANADGLVSYAEIGAFVARANQAIVNERFRPHMLTRAPRDGDLLLDLRPDHDHELRLNDRESGSHYLLESASGVRLLDFHGSGAQAVHLVRPFGDGPLYLRRVSDGTERTVPRAAGVVQLDELPVTAARDQTRGAAHHAFSQIFSLPFDTAAVEAWARQNAAHDIEDAAYRPRDQAAIVRQVTGITLLSVGAGAAVAAGIVELSAHILRGAAPANESQRDTARRNGQIETRNTIAAGLAIGALGAAAAGGLLLLWPSASPHTSEPVSELRPGVGTIEGRWRF
jgi:hypothetical protein